MCVFGIQSCNSIQCQTLIQDLEMADGYLPTLKGFMKEVWPECNPRR